LEPVGKGLVDVGVLERLVQLDGDLFRSLFVPKHDDNVLCLRKQNRYKRIRKCDLFAKILPTIKTHQDKVILGGPAKLDDLIMYGLLDTQKTAQMP
jgi:hypothetical protein